MPQLRSAPILSPGIPCLLLAHTSTPLHHPHTVWSSHSLVLTRPAANHPIGRTSAHKVSRAVNVHAQAVLTVSPQEEGLQASGYTHTHSTHTHSAHTHTHTHLKGPWHTHRNQNTHMVSHECMGERNKTLLYMEESLQYSGSAHTRMQPHKRSTCSQA